MQSGAGSPHSKAFGEERPTPRTPALSALFALHAANLLVPCKPAKYIRNKQGLVGTLRIHRTASSSRAVLPLNRGRGGPNGGPDQDVEGYRPASNPSGVKEDKKKMWQRCTERA